jgi:bla regulator protein blaR1
MNNKKDRLTLLVAIMVIAILAVGAIWYYVAAQPSPAGTGQATPPPASPTPSTSTIQYINNQYGFTFSLPASWTGYSIVTSTWTGYPLSANGTAGAAQHGPIISIRNPLWTASDTYQDIPIMVFTKEEWAAVSAGSTTVSAAPIPPSELGENSQYVFALPARYNYAFPTGYQEVQDIINSNPLQGFDAH